ncbi:Aste57867_10269 [Aphanomyces stellatus]|uniref:Aste57867_10269 protein n=1 Tax=Aphanomyces stellatus TaxID=120398 RepID=A0A485KQQ4_9STRA|nr:hypothetical protein As57867_010229 [Aphanomyces stellatus]VFT87144.1 Aste57867_10269 [Aphanomyces stellatus]
MKLNVSSVFALDTPGAKLRGACAVALLLMLAEFVGGYLAGSLSIMSDAAHMLTDVLSFVVSLLALHLSQWPRTAAMPYGFKRAEVLGAMTSILFLWIVTGILVKEAIVRLYNIAHDQDTADPVDGKTMFIIAAIALLVNILLMKILGHGHSHGHSHSHSHDHSHDHDPAVFDDDAAPDVTTTPTATAFKSLPDVPTTIPRRNLNVDAAYIHVLGDLLQNIGVLVAGAVIWARPSWHIIDPILTLVFGLIVAWTTVGICKTSLAILMEGTPVEVDTAAIEAMLQALPYVQEVHDLRVWSIASDCFALSVHVVPYNSKVDSSNGGHFHETTVLCYGVVLRRVEKEIQRHYATIKYTTIQVEDNDYVCADDSFPSSSTTSENRHGTTPYCDDRHHNHGNPVDVV